MRTLPESPRLFFRPWTSDDIELAVGLWGDPQVTAFIDARGALTRDEVRARLDEEIARGRLHGVQYWPIFLRATGEHAGCAGLRPRDAPGRVLEVGFHIRSRFWGQGLATEAATAVIAFAFETVGATALFAGHHPGNSASRHVLEKLGFRHTHDERYPPTGLDHPSYLLTEEGRRTL
jgi:RimJ/RimL family protein N-acetyltransferase